MAKSPAMPRLLLIVALAATSSCAVQRDSIAGPRTTDATTAREVRLDNLKRAGRYPWRDDGQCAVREASSTWAVLVERCYDALDLSRLQFADRDGVCAVAQAGVIPADEAIRLVGICLLVQPELAVGAVIVIGAVVVAAAIVAEIEATERPKKRKWCDCYCGKDPAPV